MEFYVNILQKEKIILCKIDNLSYSIGERTLFKNISPIIEEDEQIGLAGINGTGKSTFLKLIASFYHQIAYYNNATAKISV
ncbi:ATP-binding cassette domain-containing protein [Eggerthia catenaformis]|uniref:ATP-binding cassette domain-containing protein n=1 Tax=Eggerthia catenaformis TaxID=31973 RepID=UPI00248DA824|nr:ATP-binding cassette domain-containing protein [Eggerthia catenaformis]